MQERGILWVSLTSDALVSDIFVAHTAVQLRQNRHTSVGNRNSSGVHSRNAALAELLRLMFPLSLPSMSWFNSEACTGSDVVDMLPDMGRDVVLVTSNVLGTRRTVLVDVELGE